MSFGAWPLGWPNGTTYIELRAPSGWIMVQLKRRMPGSGPKPTATFVELIASSSGNIAECSMEVDSANGAKKVRIQMKGVPPAGLAAMIRGITG